MEKLFDQLSDVTEGRGRNGQERLLKPTEFLQLTADEVDRASRYDRPLAVAILVFDRLTQFREVEGQRKTEEVVERLLMRLTELLRGPDRTARLGPTEVGVLMPETTLKNAAAVAERMRRAIAQEAATGPNPRLGAISASIGVAAMSPRMRDPKRFLMTACFELRRAQSRGGDSVSVAEPDTVRLSIPRSGQIH